MSELREKPYAAALLAALTLAAGLVLTRAPSGSGGQEALLAADGGLAATTAAYGIAVWLFAAAVGTWFGAPPVHRTGWAGEDGGVWAKGTFDEARPAAVAVAVTLGLLTPIVLMAPLMEGKGSFTSWIVAVAMLEVAVLAGVAFGLASTGLPVLAVPIVAGTVTVIAVLAVRLVLVEVFVPAALVTPLGGVTRAAIDGAASLAAWAPLATGTGALVGALTGGFALSRDRSPGWVLLGALAAPLGLALALPLALVATGGGSVLAGSRPLEWAALAGGGLAGALLGLVLHAVTRSRSRAHV